MTRLARTTVAALLAAFAVRTAAGAHVRISPASVAAGTIATLTFRCPTERSGTPTVKLAVELPPEIAPATVRVLPVVGWRAHLSGDTVVWEGGSIPPGAAGTFSIVAGPIPAGHPLPFKAVQTYGDGEVVRWIEERAPGDPDPPYPAPVLDVR